MNKFIRELKSFSGALITLAIMLIALFFVLNWISARGWPFVSTAAGWTASHASDQAYAAPAPVVGVPSSSPMGPNI